jgi:16S rRNA (guanine527-N7)-methyltransferase
VLTEARQLGLLGPGPVEDHIEHALRFVATAPRPPRRFLDLGSGGGVPGLVLADAWPDSFAVLLDGSDRRAAFLRRAVVRLDLQARAEVVAERAELAGRRPAWRGEFDLVVARGFGPPALTAECGAPFLELGGHLLVSEPPERADRWPPEGVGMLGLAPEAAIGGIRCLVQAAACPEIYPRRRPGRPPLF